MNTEKKLVLELSRCFDYDEKRVKKLLDETKDFQFVLGHLLYNRMGGSAYYILKKCNLLGELNREVVKTLESIYKYNRIKNIEFKRQLIDFSKIFKRASFDHAFLKGAFLANNLYRKGLRTSNDFDILVNPSDIDKCTELLITNGFTQGKVAQGQIIPATRREIIYSRMNKGETVPFLKNGRYGEIVEVDVNFSMDYKASETWLIREMLSNTVKFIIGKFGGSMVEVSEENYHKGQNLLDTLSPTDFLIHLCCHLYKEATTYEWVKMGRDLSIYKFCDIYGFLRKYGNAEFMGLLELKINHYGLQKECYYALYNTGTIFGSVYETEGFWELLSKIKPADLTFMKTVVSPEEDREYTYEMDFVEWLFTVNKIEKLNSKEGEDDDNSPYGMSNNFLRLGWVW
ncbi:MAG: nucleotidyltransferase family protein [Clostridiales bacterium]|jgi:hypothetical protein|nr:nucleotidyltransferase family protein [Clostridiales bacterium]